MKVAKEIKEELVKLFSDPGFFDQDETEAADWIHRLYEPYIKQCCEDVLQMAAERAKIDQVYHAMGDFHSHHLNKKSITETEIILP